MASSSTFDCSWKLWDSSWGLTHVAVTPLDLMKCNIQMDPATYKSIGSGFGILLKAQGLFWWDYSSIMVCSRTLVSWPCKLHTGAACSVTHVEFTNGLTKVDGIEVCLHLTMRQRPSPNKWKSLVSAICIVWPWQHCWLRNLEMSTCSSPFVGYPSLDKARPRELPILAAPHQTMPV